MTQAVYELLTVTPHQPDRQHYTRAEWPIYVEGYDCALSMALRVLQAARARWLHHATDRRRAAAAERADAQRSVDAARVDVGKQCGVVAHEFLDALEQPLGSIQRKPELIGALRHAVDAREVRELGTRFTVDAPFDKSGHMVVGHGAQYAVRRSRAQSESEKETLPKSDEFTQEIRVCHPGGVTSHRRDVGEKPRDLLRKFADFSRSLFRG